MANQSSASAQEIQPDVIHEYLHGLGQEVLFHDEYQRLIMRFRTGTGDLDVDLVDLIGWVRDNRPELLSLSDAMQNLDADRRGTEQQRG